MISNTHIFFLVNIFSCTIINALPHIRYRRQSHMEDNLPYGGWGGGANNPSGAVPGAYYGSGINPNYGNVGSGSNAVEGGINVANYNGYASNWNPQQQQQQQQPYYLSNNNNAWQRPSMNNYYNQPYNRYPPGSQGWYATGGNYWYNKGQSLNLHTWLFIISIVISLICI